MAGNSFSMDDQDDLSGSSTRAILDIGLLDMQPQYLILEDTKLKIIDASSDMTVVDISHTKRNIKLEI